ncbi:MAG: hypothetical protein QXW82_07165 [Candidatus Bathyarchaeia archaeon]
MFEADVEAGVNNKNSDKHNQTNPSVQPPSQPQAITCPQCSSTNIICSGKRYNKQNIIQRYLCKNCYYRFSDPNNQQPKQNIGNRDVLQHVEKVHTLNLKSTDPITFSRQICAAQPLGAKNLAAAIKEGENWDAGATEQATKHLTTTTPGISKILEYAFALKKQGYATTTIEGRVKILKSF